MSDPTNTEKQLDKIRLLLREGENSIREHGYSSKSVTAIWQRAERKHIEEQNKINPQSPQ